MVKATLFLQLRYCCRQSTALPPSPHLRWGKWSRSCDQNWWRCYVYCSKKKANITLIYSVGFYLFFRNTIFWCHTLGPLVGIYNSVTGISCRNHGWLSVNYEFNILKFHIWGHRLSWWLDRTSKKHKVIESSSHKQVRMQKKTNKPFTWNHAPQATK